LVENVSLGDIIFILVSSAIGELIIFSQVFGFGWIASFVWSLSAVRIAFGFYLIFALILFLCIWGLQWENVSLGDIIFILVSSAIGELIIFPKCSVLGGSPHLYGRLLKLRSSKQPGAPWNATATSTAILTNAPHTSHPRAQQADFKDP
jgi:hypothetical protein